MKKVLIMLLLLASLAFGIIAVLSSCNYQIVDLEYSFTHAYISYGDGTVEKVEIRGWRDYEDGEQLQITAKDGTVYLVSSYNCVLVKEGK